MVDLGMMNQVNQRQWIRDSVLDFPRRSWCHWIWLVDRKRLSGGGQLENRDWTGMDWTIFCILAKHYFPGQRLPAFTDWETQGCLCFLSWLTIVATTRGQLENHDWTLDWTGLDWTGGSIIIIDFTLLFFVGFVLCLSFLFWVESLDWSLCLTHGRHVSLQSWRK